MKRIEERYIKDDELLYTVTHIYSEIGHFEKSTQHGLSQGWHIRLGTDAAAEDYIEIDDGASHAVPDSLPDVIIEDDIPDEEATLEDYQDALEELGVQIDREVTDEEERIEE